VNSHTFGVSRGGYDARQKIEELVNTKIWYRRESDLWAQLGKNPIQRRKVSSEDSAEVLAVGSLLPFGKRTVSLILRDRMVTWPERKGRMDG
jgi:hypothetical protein